VKKGVAILMLAFLLFNWGGYRMLSGYLETRSEDNLQAQLDQDIYDEASLLHIKVAANLPYTNSSEVYEKATGNVEINGVSYTYVKRRFHMDSLELLCIPNAEKTGIRNARDDFFRLANDFVANSSKKNTSSHPHTTKFSVSDFTEDHSFSWQFSGGISVKVKRAVRYYDLGDDYTKLLEHPPQA
jgi:hypothetical protein